MLVLLVSTILERCKVPVGNNGTRLVVHSKVDKYQSNIGHDHTIVRIQKVKDG